MMNRICLIGIFIAAFCFVTLAFPARNPHVVLQTNLGDIVVELYPEQAPVTVDNFLRYVNIDFYDGLLFHRILENFMIQGGGFYFSDGIFYRASTFDPIINESNNGLRNLRGTIAMARTSEPDSATSQFYINHIDNPHLDYENAADGYGYCVFGRVVEGMDVVDDIAALEIVQHYQEQPPPPIYFEALPPYWVGMVDAYVLGCEDSYCADLAGGEWIDFADFAVFASGWLGQCGSDNAFCDGGDLDYSGTVNAGDLEIFLMHLGYLNGYELEFSDLDDSGGIDLNDIMLLVSHWLQTDCNEQNDYCDGADIDHNGNVSFTDFSLISSHWQNTH